MGNAVNGTSTKKVTSTSFNLLNKRNQSMISHIVNIIIFLFFDILMQHWTILLNLYFMKAAEA
jgi:hypothetical protein